MLVNGVSRISKQLSKRTHGVISPKHTDSNLIAAPLTLIIGVVNGL